MLTALSCVFAGVLAVWAVSSWTRPRHYYPPGPKGLPLLGNMFDIPMRYGWETFANWSRLYGSEIVHVQALGKHICVINSAKVAKDLFDGRPHIYSDKEQSVMTQELSGWKRAWALSPYDDEWREYRKLFHQHFRPSAVPQYHHKQTKAVRRLLQLLLDTPENFLAHLRYAAGSSLLDVVYSFDALPGDSRITLVEKAVHTFARLLETGVYLVDVAPILKHIPAWFPGANFKRQAAEYKQLVDDMFKVPYQQFKDAWRRGTAQPCFAASLLADSDPYDASEHEELFINLTGTTYAAGSDTTVAAMGTFMLAMALHPEVQRWVQEELDRVVGRERLPEMADQPALPRVMATVHEVLRWHPPLPLATPHRAMADDVYAGFTIPAGSIVLGNSWAILHDDKTYTNPQTFDPRRFVGPNAQPFPEVVFGHGRRECPGRHFALDILFLAVAHVLSVFTIERVDNSDRVIGDTQGLFTPHVLSYPKPFEASFVPRFSGVESLVRTAALSEI
uniref:Cytochrome P450 n=1 Tax=Phanerodontia chrysosporium TaxID=2822231 RepID=G5EJQ6_PHACH|nr:cytochrome P450 [Phanerodontia chrysosporium]